MSGNGRRLSLYTDEDVDGRVAKQLRRLGYNALSSHAAGNSGKRLPDEWQLAYATEHGRVILTHNTGDYHRLAHLWALSDREHAGIIVSNRMSLGRLIQRVARHLELYSPDKHHNILTHLGY